MLHDHWHTSLGRCGRNGSAHALCKWFCGSFYVATGSAEKGLVILASPELRMDVLRLSRTLSCNRQLCDNSSDGDDDYTIATILLQAVLVGVLLKLFRKNARPCKRKHGGDAKADPRRLKRTLGQKHMHKGINHCWMLHAPCGRQKWSGAIFAGGHEYSRIHCIVSPHVQKANKAVKKLVSHAKEHQKEHCT